MEYLHYPFKINHLGRTSTANFEEHIRQLIEQVLFTSPGERVNRPDLGSDVLALIFSPDSPKLSTTIAANIRSSLAKYLSDLVTVENIGISHKNSSLAITVKYVIRKTQSKQVTEFRRNIS